MTYKLTNTSQPADPYYGAVSLLLHGDGADGSTQIIDNSPNPKTVTVNGNAQISTTESKFNGSSLKFDGNGDYIDADASSPDFELGSDDFTIETWVLFNSNSPNDGGIISKHTIAIPHWVELRLGSTQGAILTQVSFDGTSWGMSYQSTDLVATNTWYHIALVRSGSVFTTYINGVANGTASSASSISNNTSYPLRLGARGNADQPLDGYIDDLRITKGVARYTSNFTPPTQPFFNNFKTGYDPHYFYDVSLLLKGDGTNGSTTIVDSSFDPKTVTAAGNAQISTAQSKFGESSIRFTVDSVDHLAIPASTSLQITVAEDFTVEAWIYLLGNRTYNYFVANGGGSSREWSFAAGPTNLIFYWSTNGLGSGDQVVSRPADLPLNTWMHVAAVKVGSSFKLFKDGIQQGSDGTFTSIYGGNGTTWVGRFMDYGAISHSFNGHVDDLRITKGVARYTSNFTPPGPLPTY